MNHNDEYAIYATVSSSVFFFAVLTHLQYLILIPSQLKASRDHSLLTLC